MSLDTIATKCIWTTLILFLFFCIGHFLLQECENKAKEEKIRNEAKRLQEKSAKWAMLNLIALIISIIVKIWI